MKESQKTAIKLLNGRGEMQDGEFVSAVEQSFKWKSKDFDEPKNLPSTWPESVAIKYIDDTKKNHLAGEAHDATMFLQVIAYQKASQPHKYSGELKEETSTSTAMVVSDQDKLGFETIEADIVNYYDVLGVDPGAPEEEKDERIKNAYRTLMKNAALHPDVGGDDKIAKEIGEAYNVLKEKKSRDAYNELLKSARSKTEISAGNKILKVSAKKLEPGLENKLKLIGSGKSVSPDNDYLVIDLTPSQTKNQKAIQKTKKYTDSVLGAGILGFDRSELFELEDSGSIAEGTTSDEMTSAVFLHARGASATGMQVALDSNSFISEARRESMQRSIDVLESLRYSNVNLTSLVDQAAGYPQIAISQTSKESYQSSENRIGFEWVESKIRPLKNNYRKVVGKVKGFKKRLKGRIRKGAAKRGVKLGAKRVAIKAGKKLVVRGLLHAAGAALTGGASLVVSAAIELGLKLLKPITSRVGKFINKHKSDLAILGGVLALGGLVTSSGLLLGTGAVLLAAPFGMAILGFVVAAAVPTIALSTIIAIVGTPILIAFILFVINTSAFVVPGPGEPIPGFVPGQIPPVSSQFITLTKTPALCTGTGSNPCATTAPITNLSNNQTYRILFTITIRATTEDLTIVSFSENCNVISQTPTNCTSFETVTAGGNPVNTFPPPLPAQVISAGQSYVITYEMEFSSPNFNDSFTTDTFTVTADTLVTTGEIASISAAVIIGNPPVSCPVGWPVAPGGVTQGAYTSGHTHANSEAVDIGSVGFSTTISARHSGTVQYTSGTGAADFGNSVEVVSNCDGVPFYSRYSHMSSVFVQPGDLVTPGTPLGLTGDTGQSSGPHLHYEFRDSSGPKSFSSDPPYLMVDRQNTSIPGRYVPKDLPRNCWTYSGCGSVNIP